MRHRIRFDELSRVPLAQTMAPVAYNTRDRYPRRKTIKPSFSRSNSPRDAARYHLRAAISPDEIIIHSDASHVVY